MQDQADLSHQNSSYGHLLLLVTNSSVVNYWMKCGLIPAALQVLKYHFKREKNKTGQTPFL